MNVIFSTDTHLRCPVPVSWLHLVLGLVQRTFQYDLDRRAAPLRIVEGLEVAQPPNNRSGTS